MIPDRELQVYLEHLDELQPEIRDLVERELTRLEIQPSEAETHLKPPERGFYEKSNKEAN